MKMSTLLMAMVLLVGAASDSPNNHNLNDILKEIEKINETSTLDYFVEDLSHLAEGVNKCGDAFFCKVQHILLHQNFSRSVEEKEKPKKKMVMVIMRNLKSHINHRNVSCSQVLKNVKTSNISTQAFQFWERIRSCIQYCNLYVHK